MKMGNKRAQDRMFLHKKWWVRALPSKPDEIANLCARLFQTAEGQQVLQWLVSQTIGRSIQPEQSDQVLWYQEGRRQIVKLLIDKTEQGQKNDYHER